MADEVEKMLSDTREKRLKWFARKGRGMIGKTVSHGSLPMAKQWDGVD